MGKKYSPGTSHLSAYYDVDRNRPLDTRDVVSTYADLIDPATWGTWSIAMWVLYCYQGQLTTVVNDSDPDKNGVYLLKGDSFTTYQFLTDQSATLARDWVKVDPGTLSVTIDNYTIKDGTDDYDPNDVQVAGLHVVRVDGGEY